jgi:valyl-tRNA synthetase
MQQKRRGARGSGPSPATTSATIDQEFHVSDIRQLAQYSPEGVERRWYAAWEEAGLFVPRQEGTGPSFVITLPPPNVTGILTVGHCLGNSIQDTLIRWMRMRGRETLWVPGTDHASISTEQVVTRQLAEEGTDKRALGREGFLARAWAWKEQTHGRIIEQIKRLGCSLDWSREAFTMDEARNRAVTHAFLALKEKGLIYRDLYLVNWCPHCLTAISDDEVEHREVQGRLYTIHYPFADGEGHVSVATTRPETMFGDTAVAVHPDDPERKHLIGRQVRLPLTDRVIPIIADEHADPAKGTGFVKITPAHDPNDFEVGRRHGLPQVICMDEKAVLNEQAGQLAGLERFAGRKAALKALSEQELLGPEEKITHQVGHHDRCGTIIEPYLSRQWFLKMGQLAEPALEAVEDGTITLFPDRWVGVYYNWLRNIRDWCISRQLWWGHRIPVWYCADCQAEVAAETEPTSCPSCGGPVRQDPDVLDTWFSSWLWTFSPLGWPGRTEDLHRYHPTTVMVTAADIIFFWVARMIMASYEFLDEPPFGEVIFTGLVRDEQGRKMSKSLGNSPDPIALIDKYGADALRCSLVMLTPTGQDIFFSEASLEVGRNFCNKIFQATKLVLGAWDAAGLPAEGTASFASPDALSLDDLLAAGGPGERAPAGAVARIWERTFGAAPPVALQEGDLQAEDLWLLGRLCQTIRDCNDNMERRRLNDAAYTAFNFFRHELCDWYLEAIKPRLRDEELRPPALIVAVLTLGLSYKLLSPVMPFITEELWSSLPPARGFLMSSSYPTFTSEPPFAMVQERFARAMEIVSVVRNIRGELGVPPGRRGHVVLRAVDERTQQELSADLDRIALLAKLERVEVVCGGPAPEPAGVGVAGTVEVFLLMSGLIDLEKERERLQKELAKVEGWIAGGRAKLANERFTTGAPAAVVQRQRDQLAENEAQAQVLQRRLAALGTDRRQD